MKGYRVILKPITKSCNRGAAFGVTANTMMLCSRRGGGLSFWKVCVAALWTSPTIRNMYKVRFQSVPWSKRTDGHLDLVPGWSLYSSCPLLLRASQMSVRCWEICLIYTLIILESSDVESVQISHMWVLTWSTWALCLCQLYQHYSAVGLSLVKTLLLALTELKTWVQFTLCLYKIWHTWYLCVLYFYKWQSARQTVLQPQSWKDKQPINW